MKILKYIAAALILAGCANQPGTTKQSEMMEPAPEGLYRDGEQYFYMMTMRGLKPEFDKAGISRTIRSDLVNCMWLAYAAHMTPEERKAFDKLAQGLAPMPRSVMDNVTNRVGFTGKRGDFSALGPYCPDKIPEFATIINWK